MDAAFVSNDHYNHPSTAPAWFYIVYIYSHCPHLNVEWASWRVSCSAAVSSSGQSAFRPLKLWLPLWRLTNDVSLQTSGKVLGYRDPVMMTLLSLWHVLVTVPRPLLHLLSKGNGWNISCMITHGDIWIYSARQCIWFDGWLIVKSVITEIHMSPSVNSKVFNRAGPLQMTNISRTYAEFEYSDNKSANLSKQRSQGVTRISLSQEMC